MKEERLRILSHIVVVFAGITLYFLLMNLEAIWNGVGYIASVTAPLFCGIAFAFLLAGPTHFYERILGKFINTSPGASRAVGIVCTLVSVILLLVVLFYAMFPQLAESALALYEQIPGYTEKIQELVNRIEGSAIFGNLPWQEIMERASGILPKIYNASKQVTSGVITFFLGIVLAIYLLVAKERFVAQLKKVMFAYLPNRFVTATVRLGRFTGRTFARYISAQVLEAVILGTMCFVGMVLLRLDYALLISFIIAVFNLIPFFGPIIGAIPGAFILLMIQPIKAIWFVILVIVLQQIDGLLIAPRIVGKSTGLSAFWVLLAVIVGGRLFGFLGIVLGVPTFSVLYVLAKALIERRLEKKNLPQATASYNESHREI